MRSAQLKYHADGFSEDPQAGLAAARARGRNGGRRKALDNDKRALAVDL